MDVRGEKGTMLFGWDPKEHTVSLVKKDMFYKIKLTEDSYKVMEERPKKYSSDLNQNPNK